MKTPLLTAIVAAGLAAGPAFAAPPPPVARASDWSGPYLGGFFGYDWGRTRVIDNGVLTESGARTNGVLGGALAGYNWQRGLFVFGLEADIAAAAIRGSGIIVAPPPPAVQTAVLPDTPVNAIHAAPTRRYQHPPPAPDRSPRRSRCYTVPFPG